MWNVFWTFIKTPEGASATTAIATIVLTLTTVVYAALTWVLAKENRLLRKAGTQPQIIAYLALHPRLSGPMIFTLANVGQGPALNVSYRVKSGGDDFQTHDAKLPLPEVPMTVIPQGERYETFFGMGWDMLAEPRLKPFGIEVTFDDLKQRKYVDTFVIDVSQFDGIVTLGSDPAEELVKVAKEIATELKRWTRGLPVETHTRAEQRREDQEARDRAKKGRSP